MKIIDQTPFYNDKGEISLLDRVRSFMQLGRTWGIEMEAQKSVLPVLEKVLDKNYTLLRNVTPPGLDTPIPFILVGPTGVYVMYVTPVLGMFRAKGDQWGTISGNTFKPDKTNLLTRTERMARAVQVYLQRQGYSDMSGVEAILLCANPGVHVDSLRPIVRIVMRDALERFAVSIMQARVALSPEVVYEVVNRIINPPALKEETIVPETTGSTTSNGLMPDLDGEYNAPSFPAQDDGAAPGLWSENQPAFSLGQEVQQLVPPALDQTFPRKTKRFSKKQWIFLAFMAVIWLLLMAAFIFLVIKELYL